MIEQQNKQQQKPSGNPQQRQKGKPNNNVFWIYALIIAGIFGINFFFNSGSPVETTWREVRTKMLESQDISKVVVVNNLRRVEVYLKPDRVEKYKDKFKGRFDVPSKQGPHFYFSIGDSKAFEDNLREAQANIPESERIEPQFTDRADYLGGILSYLLPIALLVGIWIFMSRRMTGGMGGGGIFNVGKSKAQLFDKDN